MSGGVCLGFAGVVGLGPCARKIVRPWTNVPAHMNKVLWAKHMNTYANWTPWGSTCYLPEHLE
eukprot:9558328-Alexandrium_andersonii.AAC.1